MTTENDVRLYDIDTIASRLSCDSKPAPVWLVRYAVDFAGQILRDSSPEEVVRIREVLWEKIFQKLHWRAQYQSFDFCLLDYQMWDLASDLPLLRGPEPDRSRLAIGGYFVTLGAAQGFGRFCSRSFQDSVSKSAGLESVNLSFGGAGPQRFQNRRILDLANRAKFVFVQCVSGRSVGCARFPGGRVTYDVDGEFGNGKIDRIKLLNLIWKSNPEKAAFYVDRWRSNYVDIMSELLDKISGPKYLVWFSARKPEDFSMEKFVATGDAGAFPHFLDGGTIDALAPRVDGVIFQATDLGLPYKPNSNWRAGAQPFRNTYSGWQWSNSYYPSQWAHDKLAEKLVDNIDF